MTTRPPLHGAMYDLFGRCLCVLCVALEAAVRVIDEGHPTDIDSFCDYVCTFIVNSHEAERSTRREAVRQIMRFRKWCKQNDVTDITMVRQEEIKAFVHWPVMMGGRARRPGWSTMRNRRTYLRRAYKAARDLGYEIIDPTIDVVVVFDRSVEANLCTDDDIEQMREGTPVQLFSNTWVSVIALAEAGATNSEVRSVRASDVDLDEGVVRLAGNARVDERINPLTEWGTMVLRERLADLGSDDFVVTNGDDRQCSEATVSQMFKHIANYANLGSRGLNINFVYGEHVRAHAPGSLEWKALYGNRSLAESVNSWVKNKLGPGARARSLNQTHQWIDLMIMLMLRNDQSLTLYRRRTQLARTASPPAA